MKPTPFQVLSDDEIRRIHQCTLEVLNDVGIFVELKKMRDLLADNGCQVDETSRIVKFPPDMVEKFVGYAPREFTICGADPQNQWTVSPDHRLWAGLGTAFRFLDPVTGAITNATQDDVLKRVILFNHLDNITGSQMDIMAQDIPMYTIHVEAIRAWALNSGKPYGMGAYGVMATTDMMEMCGMVMGGKEKLKERRPFCAIVSIPSPLGTSQVQLEGLMIMAELNQVAIVAPEAMAGTTAPVTLAGLLVQHNAEIVSHIVMAQVVNPGAPVMYGSVSTIADMRKGSAALGAAETGMISAASAQLGHFYGVPVRAVAGATESKQLDVQCGFERGQSLLQAALAGVNYVTCVGTVESSNMGVHDLYAIDNEIIGRVERIMRGIEVNDVSLAMEQIRQAGPHGNYLMDPFTRSNFRKEHFIPKVSDRESLEGWEKSGRQSIFEKARAATEKILAEHQPRDIDPALKKELDDYVAMVGQRTEDDFKAAEWEA
jgi:trimethylamine--corrinoid protein Co-methyltransferase